nr:odorant binding protein 7 [Trissolcus basalis]
MKFFIVSCVAFSAMMVLSDARKYPDDYEKVIDECLKDMKIAEVDFDKTTADDDDEIFTCVLACANKKLEVFDGTKFNTEKILEHTEKEMAKQQVEFTAEMKGKMEKCIEAGNTAEGDECKKTGALFKCIITDEDLMKMVAEEEDKKTADLKEASPSEQVESVVPA